MKRFLLIMFNFVSGFLTSTGLGHSLRDAFFVGIISAISFLIDKVSKKEKETNVVKSADKTTVDTIQ